MKYDLRKGEKSGASLGRRLALKGKRVLYLRANKETRVGIGVDQRTEKEASDSAKRKGLSCSHPLPPSPTLPLRLFSQSPAGSGRRGHQPSFLEGLEREAAGHNRRPLDVWARPSCRFLWAFPEPPSPEVINSPCRAVVSSERIDL